ncbi:MAG: phenylacetate--CoA ligase family protein [Christensenellaceae bacterium]|nr:phenylacetate--CoA ligase family protein [Christensenellaceae bacterium]
MRTLGYCELFFKTLFFPALPKKWQEKIRKRRLEKLVIYVKKNSPFFREYYKNIGDDFDITDLPITNKQTILDHFDDWATDRNITLANCEEFLADMDNKSKRFLGKYLLVATSGSTGFPAIIVHDRTTANVSSIISLLRGFGGMFPMANICVNDGFGIDNCTIEQSTGGMPILKKVLRIVDSRQPIEDTVKELNEFKPRVIIGYTSAIYMLIPEIKSGRLRINPKFALTSGEFLSERMRREISEAFHCKVHSIYGCTEGGTLGFECQYNHKHLNEDWTYIEPVDENNNPVKPGEHSAKLLLTNLSNSTFPIIRYEVTDRIIYHDEGCACGKKSPWIEIEGRTSDILYFENDQNEKVGIPLMTLYDIIDLRGRRHFQLILRPHNHIEFRFVEEDPAKKPLIFEEIKEDILAYLANQGINKVCMELSADEPKREENRRKFRSIYQVEE